jgi:hypothetical protein
MQFQNFIVQSTNKNDPKNQTNVLVKYKFLF